MLYYYFIFNILFQQIDRLFVPVSHEDKLMLITIFDFNLLEVSVMTPPPVFHTLIVMVLNQQILPSWLVVG
jgi:hypothetical protein